jgi:hypothetical protein
MTSAMVDEPKRDQRLQTFLSEEEVRLLNEWRRRQDDLPSASEAIRRLVLKAISGK